MPICKKCFNSFPNRILIDNKIRILNKRKYCLTCSPFGKGNKLNVNSSVKREERHNICEICKKEYKYKRGNGSNTKKCVSCISKVRRHKIKSKSIEYKGGKCAVCEYSKCLSALSFHHINSKEKDFGIGGNKNKSWKSIQKELDKCILLCVRCHAEVHDGMISI